MTVNVPHHGTTVVPFRLASQRFPNKALCKFKGRPLVEHALLNAKALGLSHIVVTGPADDLKIVQQTVDLAGFNAIVIPSSIHCRTATDRLVELHARLPGDYFVSLPIDEPAIDVAEIRRILSHHDFFADTEALTFYSEFFAPEDYESPLSAKMVLDRKNRLLYMSRNVIPALKDGTVDMSLLKKNVGICVFKRPFLQQLAAQHEVSTSLDRHEGLEQLRWLELGLVVRCLKIRHIGFGIDIPSQIAALERRTQ